MLFRLIQNENTKIYRRFRTWILMGLLLVATILFTVVIHSNQHDDPNWKQSLVAQSQEMKKQLDQGAGHIPPIAANSMMQTIQLNQYYIDHNVNPHRTTGWKFAVTAENLSALLMAFIVVAAGDIVASEFSTGTIKMLLTQTATRAQILLSKYLATMLFALFMTAVLFVFSLLCGCIFFGFSGAGEPHIYTDTQGSIQQMSTVSYLLMQYGFLLVDIVITATIAFMMSAIFRSSTLAITISILAYFVGNTLVTALSRFSWVKYILFANTDLSQYVQGGPHIKGTTLGFSITMLLIYFVVMNVLSWLIFMKRDVAYT